ncbi:MAG: 50S ribosomal protein L11 methyltransferase [Muribaculaceae bacterium]|nr:50S ribosomal protein L11 methyltransferase [Muribaculaceae bacterium]
MNDYLSVRLDFSPCSADITDLAAAFLADVGYESFEPDDSGITAYIRASEDGESLAREALSDFPFESEITISSQLIEGEDWNAEWEKNYFKPILIDNLCVVHSTFHKDVPVAEYDIVIDPKMAFGTGHHDTTSQMMRHILTLPLENKEVIDMGTGTGILAFLAKMRGASKVTGIEIDRPAYENAVDNALLNNCDVNFIHGDASALKGLEKADILFANINRNIILSDLRYYSEALKPGATMLLSGFYEEDIPLIQEEAGKYGLSIVSKLISPAGWAAVRLLKRDQEK